MSDNNIDNAQKNKKPDSKNSKLEDKNNFTDSASESKSDLNAPQIKRWKWVLGIFLAIVLFIILGALGGVQSGISARQDQEQLDRAVEAVAQYQLGEIDLDKGLCEFARQRFEYVIKLNANYPGIADKLAEAMLCTGVAEVPIAIATSAPTPIEDNRSASEIFAQASAFFKAGNWDEVLPLLDTVRSIDEDFEAIQIDGMYYTALRNRGVERILVLGDLEGGIFDLNQAEQVGPLDVDAANNRDWAILYIVGQSFWEIDWAQAVQYFGQIAAVAPNLHDSSFYTAIDRYANARAGYAGDLVTSALFIVGAKGWCEADQLMQSANDYNTHSPELQPTAQWVSNQCQVNPDEEADLN